MQSDNIITRVIILDTVPNQSIGFMNAGMYVCTCVCIFVCMFICVCMCGYVSIYRLSWKIYDHTRKDEGLSSRQKREAPLDDNDQRDAKKRTHGFTAEMI